MTKESAPEPLIRPIFDEEDRRRAAEKTPLIRRYALTQEQRLQRRKDEKTSKPTSPVTPVNTGAIKPPARFSNRKPSVLISQSDAAQQQWVIFGNIEDEDGFGKQSRHQVKTRKGVYDFSQDPAVPVPNMCKQESVLPTRKTTLDEPKTSSFSVDVRGSSLHHRAANEGSSRSTSNTSADRDTGLADDTQFQYTAESAHLSEEEFLDEIDNEILVVGEDQAKNRPSKASFSSPKRPRSRTRSRSLYAYNFDFELRNTDADDDDSEDYEELLPKKRRKTQEAQTRDAALDQLKTRRALKASQKHGKAQRDNQNAKPKKAKRNPRRMPVNELVTIPERLDSPAINSDEEKPMELSQDPISQESDNVKMLTANDNTRKRWPKIRINALLRRAFGKITIEEYRIPKKPKESQIQGGLLLTPHCDGFVGKEAKPTGLYMKVKRPTKRKCSTQNMTSRIGELTMITETLEDETQQPPQRLSKLKQLHAKRTTQEKSTKSPSHIMSRRKEGLTLDNQQGNLLSQDPVFLPHEELPKQVNNQRSHRTTGVFQTRLSQKMQCAPQQERATPVIPSDSVYDKSGGSSSPLKRKQSFNFQSNQKANGQKEVTDNVTQKVLLQQSDSIERSVSQQLKMVTAVKRTARRKLSLEVAQEMMMVSIPRRVRWIRIRNNEDEDEGKAGTSSEVESLAGSFSGSESEEEDNEDQSEVELEQENYEEAGESEPEDQPYNANLSVTKLAVSEQSFEDEEEQSQSQSPSQRSDASSKAPSNPGEQFEERTAQPDDQSCSAADTEQITTTEAENRKLEVETEFSRLQSSNGILRDTVETSDPFIAIHRDNRTAHVSSLCVSVESNVLETELQVTRSATELDPQNSIVFPRDSALPDTQCSRVYSNDLELPFVVDYDSQKSPEKAEVRERGHMLSSQQSEDPDASWRPRAPTSSGIAMEVDEDIEDSPTPPPLHSRVRNYHHRRQRRQLKLRSKSSSLHEDSPTKVPARQDSGASIILGDSQFLKRHPLPDDEIPETQVAQNEVEEYAQNTQISVLPQISYFDSAIHDLQNPHNLNPSRTKSMHARVHFGAEESFHVLDNGSVPQIFQTRISPTMKVPRVLTPLDISLSQEKTPRTLLAITRENSQEWGTMPGSARKRTVSLPFKPPFKA